MTDHERHPHLRLVNRERTLHLHPEGDRAGYWCDCLDNRCGGGSPDPTDLDRLYTGQPDAAYCREHPSYDC